MAERFDFDSELRTALGSAYDVERELTGSGMSRVFVATERALNRKVVVKVLPPDLAAGVNRERFRREIQLAAQLQHPHIVPLLAAGERGDLLYFTMPFIEGESLRHALADGVRFTPRDVVRILHDVVDALAYAHERGVIHRDIKPGNVLRSGSHAVVTDFGVAKAISAAMPAVGMTTSGMAIGTPAYMAPEQLAGDPAADHRVDLYAVGLLGYELLTGEAPFKASSPQETMAAQLTSLPEPITRKRPDVSPALASLISRCLAKSPADRPQSAREIAAVLDEIELTSGASVPVRTRARSNSFLAVTAVVLVAAAALVWSQRVRSPEGSATPADTQPAAAAAAPAATLTHDDSLAIAKAIGRKLSEQQTAARARAESTSKVSSARKTATSDSIQRAQLSQMMAKIVDSLRGDIERAVLDSVARFRGIPQGSQRVIRFPSDFDTSGRGRRPQPGGDRPTVGDSSGRGRRGGPFPNMEGLGEALARVATVTELSTQAFSERRANMGPPRRLLVATPALNSRTRSLAPAIDSLADSLRRALGRSPRYLVIDADSSRAMLQRTRNISILADSMQVELVASLRVEMLPDSGVYWTITTRDQSAHGAFATRVYSARGMKQAMPAGTDTLVMRTVKAMEEMDRAPRRRASTTIAPKPPG